MTKYVLVTHFFPPSQGGIQRSAEQIANCLTGNITVIAPPQAGAEFYDQQQKYQIIRREIFTSELKRNWLWLIPWLRREQRRGLKTVLFAHYSSAVIAAWLLKPWGIKYVVFVHGRDVVVEQRRLIGRLLGPVLRGAEWVGVNSTYVSKIIAPYKIAESKRVRTHPAVPNQYLDKTPIYHTGPRLVTVGRLVKRKNIAAVLEALPQLITRLPEIHYDVIGDGPDQEELKKLSSKLGLAQYVTWHGQVDDHERDRIMQAARAFVMVPLLRDGGSDVEGLGLVYLEAAAMGLALVASATGGVTDIVDERKNGIYAKPTEPNDIARAIEQALAMDPEQSGRYGREKMISEFTDRVRNNRLRLMLGEDRPTGEIGVVIPAYNPGKTIKNTLTSLLSQTLPPQEIIVVDDGSTDNWEKEINEFRNRVKIIKQANSGAAVARNRGAQEIHCPYIFFLDADTTLKPDCLETMMLALATHPEAAYAYASFIFGPKTFWVHDFDEQKLRQINFIHTCSLIRREKFPGFDEKLKKFQDWDLWLTMLSQGGRGIWIPRVLFKVNEHYGVMSRWWPKFIYQLPGLGQGRGIKSIAKYRAAEAIIRAKHRI